MPKPIIGYIGLQTNAALQLVENLKQAFPEHTIWFFPSERDFRNAQTSFFLAEIALIVYDVSVPWSPSNTESGVIPAEVLPEISGTLPPRGGVRCRNLCDLRRRVLHKREVKALFYTVFSAEHLKDVMGLGIKPEEIVSEPLDGGDDCQHLLERVAREIGMLVST
jgi:hypothetical protein